MCFLPRTTSGAWLSRSISFPIQAKRSVERTRTTAMGLNGSGRRSAFSILIRKRSKRGLQCFFPASASMTSVPTPVSQSRPPSRLKLSSLRREQNWRCCATRWIEPACCATEYRKRRSPHERGPLPVTRQTECRYMGRLYQRRLPSDGEREDLPHVQSGQWRNHRLSRRVRRGGCRGGSACCARRLPGLEKATRGRPCQAPHQARSTG